MEWLSGKEDMRAAIRPCDGMAVRERGYESGDPALRWNGCPINEAGQFCIEKTLICVEKILIIPPCNREGRGVYRSGLKIQVLIEEKKLKNSNKISIKRGRRL